jgi:hypothetical protein
MPRAARPPPDRVAPRRPPLARVTPRLAPLARLPTVSRRADRRLAPLARLPTASRRSPPRARRRRLARRLPTVPVRRRRALAVTVHYATGPSANSAQCTRLNFY